MEGGGGGGGGEGESANGSSSSFMSAGGRQRFQVELRPGETTIVSWRKLLKDANKVKGPASVPEPPSIAQPAFESCIAPGQTAENEANDAPPASRFSAVIEKIERLYMGKNSSDEEDLNDVPDDDEYDTEDSFIDDAELDEYFQVDNSAIKHDGFFVNRGKLERTNEPTVLPNQQPKKRRRKDLAKGHGENDDGLVPNKHIKVNEKAAGSSVPLVGQNSTNPSHSMATPTVHVQDVKFQNHINVSEICVTKKFADAKTPVDPSLSRVSCGEAITVVKDVDKPKTGVQSKNHVSKLKDGIEFPAVPSQRSNDKSSYGQFKSQSGRLVNDVEELDKSVQRREKNGIRERSDIKIPENSPQTVQKNLLMQRKEGSNVKPKSTMLEKAFRELEKTVAESRPPSVEVPDADISSQAVKRRMPPEIKLKLAKVARVAHASHGKISKEVLNRLMSIVGHLIQLRSLKRNLKVMVNMGLSAKQEKDAKFQHIKKEVDEMVKMRVPLMKSKAIEQQAGASNDFQETGTQENEVLKKRYSMDETLEDKICDLYDLYVDGLEEDAGPQVRKLYAELAELWPKGFMDNHGIKRAICRAKDRKKALYNRHKDLEKLKRKKLPTPKTEETVRVEASSSTPQPQYVQEKFVTTDSANNGLTSVNKLVSNTTAVNAATARMPVNGPITDRPKQEKAKGTSSGNLSDVKTTAEVLVKKKVKRKPELGLGEAHIRPEKLSNWAQGEERHKSNKQVTSSIQKPIPQSAPAPAVAAAPPPPPPPTVSSSSANMI